MNTTTSDDAFYNQAPTTLGNVERIVHDKIPNKLIMWGTISFGILLGLFSVTILVMMMTSISILTPFRDSLDTWSRNGISVNDDKRIIFDNGSGLNSITHDSTLRKLVLKADGGVQISQDKVSKKSQLFVDNGGNRYIEIGIDNEAASYQSYIYVGGSNGVAGYKSDYLLKTDKGLVWSYFGGGHFAPSTNSLQDLGSSTNKWRDVWASGTVHSSDRELKENIRDCDLGIDFINKLLPKIYKWKDYVQTITDENDEPIEEITHTYTRNHLGLIAQDVEQVLVQSARKGENIRDFGLLVIGEDGTYGLRYEQLFAPIIKALQDLSKEISLIKSKLDSSSV